MHHGLSESDSGSACRRAQLSVSVFAVLKPPCSTMPLPGRAVTFILIEFATCVRSPKFAADVWKLSFSLVAAVAVTLYRPLSTPPPPPGRRGSLGTLMLNSV